MTCLCPCDAVISAYRASKSSLSIIYVNKKTNGSNISLMNVHVEVILWCQTITSNMHIFGIILPIFLVTRHITIIVATQ